MAQHDDHKLTLNSHPLDMMAPLQTGKQKVKYSMVADGCYKSLGLLSMPREGWTVQSMDSLTTWELTGNVVYDSFTAAHMLGHTIDVIFTTFAQEVQSFLPLSLMELFTIPWASLPTGIHVVTSLTYHQSLQVCAWSFHLHNLF